MKRKAFFHSRTAIVLILSVFITQFQGSFIEVKASTPAGSGARSYTNPSTGDVFLGGKFLEVGITKEGSLGTEVLHQWHQSRLRMM